jgi:hypothetical protein
MNAHRSRWLIVVARWALMSGIAGVVLAALAFTDRLSSPGPSQARETLMIMSAVLLALSFVLAPLVRRAFDALPGREARRGGRKTLLDEMRDQPEEAWNELARNQAPSSATLSGSGARRSIVRAIAVLYVVFGLVLVSVLLTM